jgi:monothiol glutaredoxin
VTPETKKKIEDSIRNNKVMLFMKGVPDFPQCGFSARAVECLERVGAQYGAVDVLADYDVREGIKQYSSWPTIPQIYIAGEFVGGCDIVVEMLQNGELKRLVEQAGATAAQ